MDHTSWNENVYSLEAFVSNEQSSNTLDTDETVLVNDKGDIMWTMSGISDSTWRSNKEDGASVMGYILYFMGVSIAWKSKQQAYVSLSSLEGEYIAISELAKSNTLCKTSTGGYEHQGEVSD